MIPHSISSRLNEPYSYCRLIYDGEGKPIDYEFLDVNPKFEEMMGLNAEEIIDKRVTEVIPGIRGKGTDWIELFGTAVKNQIDEEFDFYSIPLNKWYKGIVYSPSKDHFITLFNGIKEKEENELLLKSGNDIILQFDEDYTLRKVITSKEDLLFFPKDELIGKNVTELYPPEVSSKVIRTLQNTKRSGEIQVLEYPLIIENENKWFSAEVQYLTFGTGKNNYIVKISDITEKKHAENNRILLNNIPIQLWCLIDGHTYGAVNQSHADFLGFKVTDIEFKDMYSFLDLEMMETCCISNREVFSKKVVVKTHEWVPNSSGEMRLLSITKSPILDDKGNVEYVVCTAEDITENEDIYEFSSKSTRNSIVDEEFEREFGILTPSETSNQKAQQNAKKLKYLTKIKKEKYRSLVTQLSDMLYLHDLSGNIFEINNSAIESSGYSREELLNMTVFDLHVDKNNQDEIIRQWESWPANHRFSIKTHHKTKDGHIYPVEIRGNKIEILDDHYILALVQDITEKKKLEEAERNQIIIHEIHHRVKNNLQVINSLLNMQSRVFKDQPMLANALKDSQSRIRSMTIAHEKLYRTDVIGCIEIADYIKTLTDSITSIYSAQKMKVTTEIDIEQTYLDMDIVIPLGMIINECVTNSYKHAFIDQDAGKITIEFNEFGDHYNFVVKDDGIGIPEDLDYMKLNSLGFKIINLLAKQLQGDLKLDNVGGTCYTLLIPKND